MLSKKQIKEFIEEFEENYLNKKEGQNHLKAYEREKEEVKRYFNEIKTKDENGEDITDDVVYKLLPNNPIQDIEAFMGRIPRSSVWGVAYKGSNVKIWFEGAGWHAEENWPKVAQIVFRLVDGLITDGNSRHIKDFLQSEYSKGFQTGIISPVLYCLDPQFLVINNKSVDTVKYLAEKNLIDSKLDNYLDNVNKLRDFIVELEVSLFENFDVFDMFCHWMCDKRLGGYARVPKASEEISEANARDIAITTKEPKELETVYLKFKHRPMIVRRVVDNPHCPSHVKRDYLDYVLTKHLPRFRGRLRTEIYEWDDLLQATKICLEVWNPPREIAPIVEIDVEDPAINEIFQSLANHKQVVLYGPPGTSKTYYAKGLAKTLVGGEEKYTSNVLFVQFHPSYSYEDFVEGLFPEADDQGNVIFKIKEQIFKNVCKKAEDNPREGFVLILDEINRADLAKVFGEIFSALEYRKDTVRLIYSGVDFTIPANLYILGTMNTLDKSTVDMDFAFMRRFKFFEVPPSIETLRKLLEENGVERDLVEKVTDMFDKIQRIYPLGHAYFKDVKNKNDLKLLWEHQLNFLLKEYFGDIKREDYEKAKELYFGGLGIEKD